MGSQAVAALGRAPDMSIYWVAARACRALASQEEQAATRIDNPGMRGPIENTAKRAAALAERFEKARRKA
jgi:hypothetical protein